MSKAPGFILARCFTPIVYLGTGCYHLGFSLQFLRRSLSYAND